MKSTNPDSLGRGVPIGRIDGRTIASEQTCMFSYPKRAKNERTERLFGVVRWSCPYFKVTFFVRNFCSIHLQSSQYKDKGNKNYNQVHETTYR